MRGGAGRPRAGAAGGSDAGPDIAALAALQRFAGNRAVSEALGAARGAGAPPVVQRLVGLAKESRITRVARARVPWNSQATDLERAQAHAAPALDALRRADVPRPAIVGGQPAAGYSAEFRPGRWEILVNLGKYPAAVAADEERRRLIADLYHEARHADQYYLAARYIAAKSALQRTADEVFVWNRVDPVVRVDAQRDRPPREGRLTLDRSRRKYAAAEARAADYVRDFARQPQIQARMQEPARLIAEIDAALPTVPAQFASAAERQQWNARLASFEQRRIDARNQYWTGWLQYVESAVERDAYGLGGRLGGTQAPDAQARRHMTDNEDARVHIALDRLRQRIAAVVPPLPATPPPALPAEEQEDQPPPLPVTLPPPVPADDEPDQPPPLPATLPPPVPDDDEPDQAPPLPATLPPPVPDDDELERLAVQTKLDVVAQRHAVPEDIEDAVDESA